MQLDYIPNINEFEEDVVRLYNFDMEQAIKFRDLIISEIIQKKRKINLSEIDFIEPRNCNMVMGLFHTDEGILTEDYQNFFCILTLQGYIDMVKALEPYCQKETKGYKFLYDIDTPIDFLFSPAGT